MLDKLLQISHIKVPDGEELFNVELSGNARVRGVAVENGCPILFVEAVPGSEVKRTFRSFPANTAIICDPGKRLVYRGSYLSPTLAYHFHVYEESDY